MNKETLTELLKELAEADLKSGTDIHDHPCSVAVRALDQCFIDIDTLRGLAPHSSTYTKRTQILVREPYKPDW